MSLIDNVVRCRTPFIACDVTSGKLTALNNTADCAGLVARCSVRYVLTDELTRLCASLAYSKGASTVAWADLLHAPAENLWVEWCHEPWASTLQQHGFAPDPDIQSRGRHGAWIRSSRDGRCGLVRTFWSATADDVLASNVEACFDFDTAEGEEPQPLGRTAGFPGRVHDGERSADDILGRCFRFRYEQSWSEYYDGRGASGELGSALWRHALGTIAIDIPLLLTFFLLLATRNGLPQHAQTFEHLNRHRLRRGKAPLLEHIEVRVPMLPEHQAGPRAEPQTTRMSPRLHHVRGHLVRRGSQIFWRVPHLRGSVRSGIAARARTVIWTFDEGRSQKGRPERNQGAVSSSANPA